MFAWLIPVAEWFLGFSPQQKAAIDKAYPSLSKLIDLLDKSQETINNAVPVVNQLIQLINEAQPEIASLIPAIEAILDVLAKHTAAGHSPTDAINNIKTTLSKIQVVPKGGHK